MNDRPTRYPQDEYGLHATDLLHQKYGLLDERIRKCEDWILITESELNHSTKWREQVEVRVEKLNGRADATNTKIDDIKIVTDRTKFIGALILGLLASISAFASVYKAFH